jgi:hypothetical protein
MFNTFTNSFKAGQRPGIIATPTDILNLAVWYAADLGNSINFGATIANGATVASWKDKSGSGHDANQSGNAATKPKWYSGLYNQSRYGAVRFNGTSESLNINPIAYLQNLSGYTIYITAKPISTSTGQVVTSTDTDGYKFYHNGTNWGVKTSGGDGISTAAIDTSRLNVLGMVFDGSKSTNATRLRFRCNTVEQTSSFTGTVGSTTNVSAAKYYVGVDNTGTAGWYNGEIGDVIIWTRALTTSELTSVENYLRSHWGI